MTVARKSGELELDRLGSRSGISMSPTPPECLVMVPRLVRDMITRWAGTVGAAPSAAAGKSDLAGAAWKFAGIASFGLDAPMVAKRCCDLVLQRGSGVDRRRISTARTSGSDSPTLMATAA